MGRTKRQNNTLPTVPEPSSQASTDAPSPARVTLPGDLSGSLKYLDDAQLQRLREAVTVETNSRNQGAPKNKAATGTPSEGQSAPFRDKKLREVDEIPEGKVNLIRASFRAGIKPAAIARTFRISRSVVSLVLSSAEKPKQ
jgi:DNA invertase Pin-like site-specific DNA recombinase